MKLYLSLLCPAHRKICALHQIVTGSETCSKEKKISLAFAIHNFPTWLIASCVITLALGGEGLKMSPCLVSSVQKECEIDIVPIEAGLGDPAAAGPLQSPWDTEPRYWLLWPSELNPFESI